jgi:hypothetical protein
VTKATLSMVWSSVPGAPVPVSQKRLAIWAFPAWQCLWQGSSTRFNRGLIFFLERLVREPEQNYKFVDCKLTARIPKIYLIWYRVYREWCDKQKHPVSGRSCGQKQLVDEGSKENGKNRANLRATNRRITAQYNSGVKNSISEPTIRWDYFPGTHKVIAIEQCFHAPKNSGCSGGKGGSDPVLDGCT